MTETWWQNAVVYQIYPRSFQDSDGDGDGDLGGIIARLGHIQTLGADAIWLSPVYPSPMADMGYDVSDYTDVDPRYGTLADLDRLIAEAHTRGLRVLLDIVPCHTSIEHRWFREHPDWYVWSDRGGPQNNWRSTFGGSAWSRDPASGRWYLHSFYPEQPDLDWRNPEVRAAMGDVLRFWRARGVDGFRLDALDRLMKDPDLRDDPPWPGGERALPEGNADYAGLDHVHSLDAPDIGEAVASLRAAAGDDAFLVGEIYQPAANLGPYLEHLDVAFAFELFHAPWTAETVRAALAAAGPGAAWVLSNHDFPRLPSRVGPQHVRAAALLALTLPGPVFVYAGDEIGMPDGPGGDPPVDRAGRDGHRHPVRWTAGGGFTTATPWLPMIDVPGGSVAEQEHDPASLLRLYRDLVALRRELSGPLTLVDAAPGIVAYRRGEDHLVTLNLAQERLPAPPAGAVLRHTGQHTGKAPEYLAPGEGFVGLARG